MKRELSIILIIFASLLVFGCSHTAPEKMGDSVFPTGSEIDPEQPTQSMPANGNQNIDEMIVNDPIIEPVVEESELSGGRIIEITNKGFQPFKLVINSGDKVTFINKDHTKHWPASANHPTHTLYPESGGCIGSAFDACKGLEKEESWEFTFTEIGSWNYHDHLIPSLRGIIEVQ